MTVLRTLLAIAAFVGLFLLALDNTDPVTVRAFGVAAWQAPLVFVVFLAFAAGAGIGLAVGAARASRLKRQLARARRERRPATREPAPHGAIPAELAPPRDAA